MSRRVAGVGEVLWDLLPAGRQLGGAPANFAYHAAALGAKARVVSRVGRDADGGELVRRLSAMGITTDAIEVDPLAPTGTVGVTLGPDGQPAYTIHPDVAWDRLAGQPAARLAMATADAIYFGTLAQRSAESRATIRTLIAMTRPEALRVFDINLRQHFHSREVIEHSLGLANVLKVNETELPQLAALFGLGGDERDQVDALARRFELRAVAYTRGGRGCLLRLGDQWSDHPGLPTRVADTVGAGDSFTAALVLGLLAGWPADIVNERATAIAAYVCSQPGATPFLPAELRSPFLVA